MSTGSVLLFLSLRHSYEFMTSGNVLFTEGVLLTVCLVAIGLKIYSIHSIACIVS